MKTLGFVLRSTGRAGILMAILGALGAAFNGGLIAVVHRAISSTSIKPELALSFIGLGAGKVLIAYVSGRVAESYSQQSVTRLRRELIRKLLAVPYRRFERVGSARAYAALTNDIMTIHGSLQATAQTLVSAAVLAGGGAYLVQLDPRACVALAALCAIGALIYRTMSARARASLARARDEHDRLFARFEDLTDGIKELKLNAARRRAFLDGPLFETTEAMMTHEIIGHSRYLLGQAVNGLLVLAAVGALLFAVPIASELRTGIVSGFVLTGLYLMGPLTGLLSLAPMYAAMQLALSRIEEVGVRLGEAESEAAADPDARPSFSRIELRDVVHRYHAHGGFVLGPLSLCIRPGEIVFVTGSNGCGKSTLARLLAGLYEPDGGEVVWDGRIVGERERDSYRQLFSAVFSEFRVFDRLYGLESADLDARANAWLSELGLAHVLHVRDGAPSSVELSRGQRKRLALLTALLEDRPVYLFDEWAGDQDPQFKQVFYRRLLSQLRGRGKAVLVITHDDRYFDAADRVVELADGKIVEASVDASSSSLH